MWTEVTMLSAYAFIVFILAVRKLRMKVA
jgi:hypothetical protein